MIAMEHGQLRYDLQVHVLSVFGYEQERRDKKAVFEWPVFLTENESTKTTAKSFRTIAKSVKRAILEA